MVTVIIVSALVWIYALSGAARRDPPNKLSVPDFATAAEPICADAMAALDALPAAATASGPQERADVLDEGGAILSAMVDDGLRPLAPTAPARDAEMVQEWLSDWDTYIADRAGYADRLREDPDARFYVSEKERMQITKGIDDLAEVNEMPSCATPGDVY